MRFKSSNRPVVIDVCPPTFERAYLQEEGCRLGEEKDEIGDGISDSCNATISTPPNSKKVRAFHVFVVKNLLDACYLLLILHALTHGQRNPQMGKEAFTFNTETGCKVDQLR